MSTEQKILEIIEAPLTGMGYNIVRLRLLASGGIAPKKILEILIERLDEVHTSIGDCKQASYHISALLDVEDVIEGRYNLEVSSAGVERPLVKLEDFVKYSGYVIEVKLHNAVEACKKYQGHLIEVLENKIILKTSTNPNLQLEFANIKDAKLVLTDELFKKIVK